jgi:hypothetical protein
VGTGQATQADEVNILLNSRRGDLFGGLVAARVDYFITGIPKGPGENSRPAVMAVQTGFGNHNAYSFFCHIVSS